jgi:hypothetical protein
MEKINLRSNTIEEDVGVIEDREIELENKEEIDSIIRETNELSEELQSLNYDQLDKDRQKKIGAKLTVIFSLLAVAGLCLAGNNWGSMGDVNFVVEAGEVVERATSQAFSQGLGIKIATLGSVLAYASNLYRKGKFNN